MPVSSDEVAHLLRRAGFGGTSAEIAALTSLNLDRAGLVNRILDLSSAPPDTMPAFITDENLGEWERVEKLIMWWIDRMATSPCPLSEKMTLFWHGHFVVGRDKVQCPRHLYDQLHLFRTNALGNFRDLTRAVGRDPAMLVYLDNDPNEVGSPNENFARELMELFTLGLDQYTQDDIIASARAWTGHGLTESETYPVYEFHPTKHDNGNKTFFGTTRNWDGPEIIDEICNGAKRPIMARFIAKKVFSFFAYPGPSDTIVQQLADVFIANGLSIRELVRAVFMHDQFWSDTARNGLIRTPVEFAVAAIRHTGVGTYDANPQWWLSEMGQKPLEPPNVAGWKQNAYWLSATSLWAKASFAQNLGWKVGEGSLLEDLKANTLTPSAAIQIAFDRFGITNPSPQTRQRLESWIATERANDRWFIPPGLTTALLLTPEFQLA
ncbi:MAG: DUF1800 family protein [Acidimicrobiia bacterium]